MTCILGYSNGKEVHIVGDSGGFSNCDKVIRADEKVFRLGDDFIVGFAGSFRLGQIIRYDFDPPLRPSGISDINYLISHFVDALRQVLKDKGYSVISDSQESMDDGLFLLGYRGKLYTIYPDFQVSISIDGIDAVGYAAQYAMIAFDCLSNIKSIKRRLATSLEVVEKRCTALCQQFIYEVLK